MSNVIQARADVWLMLDSDQEGLYACMICGKRFSDYDEVQQHKRK
jgi:hypothetical protein